MIKEIKKKVVEFEDSKIDIARIVSSGVSNTATLSISAEPNIYTKVDLEINQPTLVYVPEVGVVQVKLVGVDVNYVEVKVTNTFGSINLNHINSIDNSPFTERDKVVIKGKLDNLISSVSEDDNIPEDVKEDIITNVVYVKESMERMGRKDWFILSLGLLGNLATGAIYAPEPATQVATSIATSIPYIFASVADIMPQATHALTMLSKNS
ncbi:hypothetical protein WKI32_11335 [Vibrio alginolyticus]